MKLLSWNCRSLASDVAVLELLDIQGRVRADFVFISESHRDKEGADRVRRRLGFNSMWVEASDGRSGGLVLFYNK
jgi:exonuclease III